MKANGFSIVEALLSFPKTIFFNFLVLPVQQAVKLPFAVSYHVRLKGINKRSFIVESKKLKTLSMRICLGSSPYLGGIRENKRGALICTRHGKIVLKGNASFSQGCIICADNCTIVFGDGFKCNHSATIASSDSDISFGKHVICGYNVTIKNSDGHYIIEHGERKQNHKPIFIGNNVWICSNACVFKGTTVGDNSVVAWGALVTKANGEKGVMYAGIPARIIKSGIMWEP